LGLTSALDDFAIEAPAGQIAGVTARPFAGKQGRLLLVNHPPQWWSPIKGARPLFRKGRPPHESERVAFYLKCIL
jgi:hypothetical protein